MAPGIELMRRVAKSVMMVSIHGPASTMVRKMAISFGTKESVISLICVAAWKTLTVRPVTRAARKSGALISRATMVNLQKANLSFQQMVQVRNRLVSAYQDIMNMPM